VCYSVYVPTTETAVYLRQSKDREGNELAISRQRDGCLKLCREKGWNTIREYPDNDRSATNGKPRPKYQLMLKDIAAGKVTRVVVWDLDRLHRQPIELEQFMKLADSKQLALATVTGDVDLATDNGRLFARIKGAVAMSEVERKSARQKAAAEQMAKQEGGGRPWWPQRPFGYDADRHLITGKWTAKNPIRKHPTEAELLKQAYTDFNAGTKLYTIAARWNEAGVKTPRGNTWTGSGVRDLLLLARNAGLRELRGEVVGKGTWPEIVTEEVWRAAVHKLEDPKRGTNAPRGRKYLLSGVARCGPCGAGLTSHISVKGKRQYVCNACRKITRNGIKLDALITEAVVRRLSRPDAVELLLPDEPEVDTDALREQRRALEDGLVRLGKDFANAPATFRQSALSDMQEKLDVINAQLEDPGKVNIYEGVIGAEDVGKAFDSIDLGRQRTIVDALMIITINPVGKGTPVFDPDAVVNGKRAVDVVWKEDL
jgi:DNA invertase Pin-like site-specific DNA recombinase